MSIKRRENPEVFINVAPLVEVMLVLIIIFMLTAPTLNVGIHIDLPKTNASEINDSKDAPIIVSINKSGEVFLEETKMSVEELVSKLPYLSRTVTTDTVYVRGDKDLPYGKIVEIMGLISDSGYCKVSLIADRDVSLHATQKNVLNEQNALHDFNDGKLQATQHKGDVTTKNPSNVTHLPKIS